MLIGFWNQIRAVTFRFRRLYKYKPWGKGKKYNMLDTKVGCSVEYIYSANHSVRSVQYTIAAVFMLGLLCQVDKRPQPGND